MERHITYVYFFCVKNIIPIPSPNGTETQQILDSNMRERFDLHFDKVTPCFTENTIFEIPYMSLIFDSVNNLHGLQNIDQLNLLYFQGYRHMVELLAKIAYAVFNLKAVLSYSALKDFHIYDISSLISVHSNCIDSIYADLGGLVV